MGNGKQMSFSLDLNTARESLSRTDADRVFRVDGAAQLKARLSNDVLLKGICSSERDEERSVYVLYCVP